MFSLLAFNAADEFLSVKTAFEHGNTSFIYGYYTSNFMAKKCFNGQLIENVRHIPEYVTVYQKSHGRIMVVLQKGGGV